MAHSLLDDVHRREAWLRALGGSRFLFRVLHRYPELLETWLKRPEWIEAAWSPEALSDEVRQLIGHYQQHQDRMAGMRRARQWLMARIAFRDLAGWSDFSATSRELNTLAEVILEQAVDIALATQKDRFGLPRTVTGEEATLTVLAMGKLGTRELNFSSDIDLIFVYTDEGETEGPRKLDNATFFTRVGRLIIQLLSETTADGFAFRVDLRLRPHGSGGPLVHTVGALEQYYQVHGREWERLALVRARAVAGDSVQGKWLLEALCPFVFRRYLDFGAIEAVRDLKAQIQRQVGNRRYGDNIKLGQGGIREVEFIVQAFQLLYGGRHPELREGSTLIALRRLAEQKLFPPHEADRLGSAYEFLRKLENRLQMMEDRSTHSLPKDDETREVLAVGLGYASAEELIKVLEAHRERVQEAFDQAFAAPQAQQSAEASPLERLWRDELSESEAKQVLGEQGYLAPERALERLKQLRQEKFLERLTATGRDRLDRLMPLVLGAAGETPDPTTTLSRLVEVLEAIGGRTTYFALLAENPVALSQVVRLCGGSPFLARFLGRHPMLLDEVLDPEQLYANRSRASRQAHLDRELGTALDLEDRLNALRRFKSIEILHLTARDLQGQASLEEVSQGLTDVAELALNRALALAWEELTERFGCPQCVEVGERRTATFGVIGMGKLGGQELGYGSDLDLLFLHDSRGEAQYTEGGRGNGQSIDNERFFARLGQRLIHFLTTLTAEGPLYRIDMRLRPGGKAGPLVASLDHFRSYHLEQAWIWEYQALLRSRPVAASGAVKKAFQSLRTEILTWPRDPGALTQAVRNMRRRMLSESTRSADVFNLKQDWGGLIDIEFLIQYLCLRHATNYPTILVPSNRAALSALAQSHLLEEETAQGLDTAYVLYRTLENRVKLFEDRTQVEITSDPTWQERLDRMVNPEWRPVARQTEQARHRVVAAFEATIGRP